MKSFKGVNAQVADASYPQPTYIRRIRPRCLHTQPIKALQFPQTFVGTEETGTELIKNSIAAKNGTWRVHVCTREDEMDPSRRSKQESKDQNVTLQLLFSFLGNLVIDFPVLPRLATWIQASFRHPSYPWACDPSRTLQTVFRDLSCGTTKGGHTQNKQAIDKTWALLDILKGCGWPCPTDPDDPLTWRPLLADMTHLFAENWVHREFLFSFFGTFSLT